MVHDFYVPMGGFTFEHADNTTSDSESTSAAPKRLEVVNLDWLHENHPDSLPDLPDRSILDKSKADGLAKAVLLGQAIWFCLTSLTRLIQGLPLSLLEVTTLAHAFCAFVTYILWWHKPFNIHEPIVLKFDFVVGKNAKIDDANDNVVFSSLTLFAIIFGATHVAAWNSSFPTAVERIMWRCAGLIVCGFVPVGFVSSRFCFSSTIRWRVRFMIHIILMLLDLRGSCCMYARACFCSWKVFGSCGSFRQVRSSWRLGQVISRIFRNTYMCCSFLFSDTSVDILSMDFFVLSRLLKYKQTIVSLIQTGFLQVRRLLGANLI